MPNVEDIGKLILDCQPFLRKLLCHMKEQYVEDTAAFKFNGRISNLDECDKEN
jgi:hypothetical protein